MVRSELLVILREKQATLNALTEELSDLFDQVGGNEALLDEDEFHILDAAVSGLHQVIEHPFDWYDDDEEGD